MVTTGSSTLVASIVALAACGGPVAPQPTAAPPEHHSARTADAGVADASVDAGTALSPMEQARADQRRGRQAFDLGDYQEALEHFKRALDAAADREPSLFYDLAETYDRLNDCKSAIFFYKVFASRTKNREERRYAEARVQELDKPCRERKPPLP